MSFSVTNTPNYAYIQGVDIFQLESDDITKTHSPNSPDDLIIDLVAFRYSYVREFILMIGVVGTGGLLFLFLQWFPDWYFLARHVKERDLKRATHFMIKGPDESPVFVQFNKTTPAQAFSKTHSSNHFSDSPPSQSAINPTGSGLVTSSNDKEDPVFTEVEFEKYDNYVETMIATTKAKSDVEDNDNDSNEVEYFSSKNPSIVSLHDTACDSNGDEDEDNVTTSGVSRKQSKPASIIGNDGFRQYNYKTVESPLFGLDQEVRYFVYRQLRHLYHEETNTFVVCNGLVQSDEYVCISERVLYLGLSMPEYKNNLAYFGSNVTDIEIKGALTILVTQCLHFFYFFQACSVVLWFYNSYVIYASSILFVTIVSLIFDVYETRTNLMKLRKLAFFYELVTVLRDGRETEIRSLDLVPGDIFYLPNSTFTIPCDSAILEGACIVNESMLTGESAAVPKLSLSHDSETGKLIFKPLHDTRCIIYCGTRLVQTRGRVKAMVLNTGFSSKKGSLIRSILFAKEDNFKFYRDVVKFVSVLGVLAAIGFTYSTVLFALRGVDPLEIFLTSLDIITIVVPPALPTCVAMGSMFAIQRLKRGKIYCIHPSKVNVAGMIDCFVFDKTGTLTEDGLTVWGVSSAIPKIINDNTTDDNKDNLFVGKTRTMDSDEITAHKKFVFSENKNIYSSLLDSMSNNNGSNFDDDDDEYNCNNSRFSEMNCDVSYSINNASSPAHLMQYERALPADMISAMATCHSLNMINNELVGDIVDLKMFESLNFSFFDPHNSDQDAHKFNFSPDSSASTVPKRSSITTTATIDSLNLPSSVNPLLYHNIVSSNDYGDDDSQYGLLKTFPFSSALQRMSVVVQNLRSKKVYCYLKGSPEIVLDLCSKTGANIPEDYQQQLDKYTSSGYRLLALAGKEIHFTSASSLSPSAERLNKKSDTSPTNESKLTFDDIKNMKRETIEREFTFYGFLILQNKIKKETKGAIRKLKQANIRTIMCTGDNILTSIAVAREAHMIPKDDYVFMGRLATNELNHTESVVWSEVSHPEITFDLETQLGLPTINGRPYTLAITGKALNVLESLSISSGDTSSVTEFDDRGLLYNKLLIYIDIYSRMSPEHKTHLVDDLKQLDYYVGMCGDGANDCGALTSADVGLSLSREEASIAAAFTYRHENVHIGSVVKLIREGRASLSATFSIFKFMAIYSFIQLTTIVMLYYDNVNLGDYQYLYIDLILIFPISLAMGYTGAYHKVTKDRFVKSLISPLVMVSLTLIVGIQMVFQLGTYLWMKRQVWYHAFDPDADPSVDISTQTTENTVLFYATTFQYIGCAVAVNTGRPFRKALYNNVIFVALIIAYFTFQTVILFNPSKFVKEKLELVWLPSTGMNTIYTLALTCCAITIALEHLVLNSRFGHAFFNRFTKGFDKEKYKLVKKKVASLLDI